MVKLGDKRKILTIVLSLILLLADLCISVGSVLGTLFGDITIVPSVAYIIFVLVTAAAILIATRDMRTTIMKLRSSISPDPAVESSKVMSPSKGGGSSVVATASGGSTAPPSAPKAPSAAASKKGKDKQHSSASSAVISTPPKSSVKTIQHDLLVKLESAEIWMTRCGVMMVVVAISVALLGSGLPYKGPNEFAVFVVALILDQLTSYFEMRVISVAIGKVG